MNVFTWSVPFVSEKVSEILLNIIKKESEIEYHDDSDNYSKINETITTSLKLKMKFISMLMKMFRTLREENELIIKLKGFCPGNRIPKGLLIQGSEALKTALDRYKEAKRMDEENEKMPEHYK
jgi:serine/threonine-protein phosphatase 2B catalytic subunit